MAWLADFLPGERVRVPKSKPKLSDTLNVHSYKSEPKFSVYAWQMNQFLS